MNLPSFKASLSQDAPPKDTSVYLAALWQDAKGNWEQAHDLIQDLEDKNAYWIHAYLHRKEGDVGNADYWYRRSGKKMFNGSLEKEWEEIAAAMI